MQEIVDKKAIIKMQGILAFSDAGNTPAANPPRRDITALLAAADEPAYYFAYGSNMWKAQMAERCPGNAFIGIGCLEGWRWQINERGYANAVEKTREEGTEEQDLDQIRPQNLNLNLDLDQDQEQEQTSQKVDTRSGKKTNGSDAVVWGLIYTITKDDEASLDVNEGVPYAYTKEIRPVRLWRASKVNQTAVKQGRGNPKSTVVAGIVGDEVFASGEPCSVIVYVDRKRVSDSEPNTPYIYRMNRAIEDASKAGVPPSYLAESLRSFIPID